MSDKPNRLVSFRVNERTWKYFEKKCKKDGIPPTQKIRELIQKHLWETLDLGE